MPLDQSHWIGQAETTLSSPGTVVWGKSVDRALQASTKRRFYRMYFLEWNLRVEQVEKALMRLDVY